MVFRSARGIPESGAAAGRSVRVRGIPHQAYDKTENRGVRLLVPLSGLRPYGYCERK